MDIVGTYKEEFNNKLGVSLPIGNIYKSDGFIKHIQKRHANYVNYIGNIPDIINNPDYIGTNTKEPNSIELIKVYPQDNIQIAVKLDISQNSLYVASLYPISQSKLNNRLNSGRIKKY